MTPFGLSGLLAGISSLSLGIFVLLKCPEKRVGRIWFHFSLSVAGWEFGALGIGCARTPQLASLSWSFGYILGVIWIAPTLYHFICIFLGQEKRKSILIHYGIGILFLTTYPTHYFFKRMDFMWNSIYFMRSGPLHYIFFIWWVGLVVYSHYLMLLAYSQVSLIKKDQIKYFLTATIIGFGGGSICYLPDFGIDLYPWGNFLVFPYSIIMSYAILKHRLMDITVVIRKTLIYSLVSGILAATYAGFITLLAYLIGSGNRNPVTYSSPWASASTMAHFIVSRIQMSFSDACIAVALLSGGFGSLVLYKGDRKKLNVLWCVFCLVIAVWSFGLGMVVRSETFVQAYFWARWFCNIGAIFIPIVFLHFVMTLLKRRAFQSLTVGYSIAIFLSVITLSGNMVTVRQPPPFHYYPWPLPLYWVFIVFFFGLVLYAHGLLAMEIRNTDGNLKKQLVAIFIGTSVGFIGGSTTFFPAFGISIFPYGGYAVPIYILAISYAIFKHQLMDINVVIRKTLFYSLVSAALASVYVGTITLIAHVLGERHGSVSAVSSAFAAICITILFNPVRVRIQLFVDRYFSRAAIDETVLREITGTLVHEIKTPLANISLPAELTLMDMEDISRGKSPTEEVISKIKKRMQYIMDQALLAGSKVEAVREATVASDIAKGAFDLNKVLESSLNQMRDRLQKPPVIVKMHVPETLLPISGSAPQLEIVFANLIKNAAEAMEALPASAPHEIHIEANVDDGFIAVCVSDTGPGVARDHLEKIFQSHYTTKGSRGSGMGLFLSRQIVQAHGGSIQVENGANGGARFCIRLPYRENRRQPDSA